MTKLNNLLSKISTQIAITVATLCILLFMILNIIVVEQSRNIFTSVIQAVKVEPRAGVSQRFTIDRIGNYDIVRIVPNYSYEVGTFQANSDGSIPSLPLLERFSSLFQTSIIWVSFISIILSVVIGILVAKLFTNPLNQLSIGMDKLRNNNYKIELEETGTAEFDNVIQEFNTLTKELQRVEDLRKDLISDTSHELKTPLTSLIGQLEGIKDGVLEVDANRIEVLLAQTHRLNDLIDQMQEFSRIRNKNLEVRKEKLEFRNLINEVFSQYKEQMNKKQIAMNLQIDNELIIEGDYEMLQRVFENLFNNTIKYSKAKNIYISANSSEIIFADDGIGVEKTHLPYLFERFYRVEKSRNRKTGGLGLGLSIVKEIIEVHGWKIEVRNRDNGGLEFAIKFL